MNLKNYSEGENCQFQTALGGVRRPGTNYRGVLKYTKTTQSRRTRIPQ